MPRNGLWHPVPLAGLPLVVVYVWGKALYLFALWVNVLIVGLLEAIYGAFMACPLVGIGCGGKGWNGFKMIAYKYSIL